ncbi:MAG: aspartate--tRNA ligase [Candidatus Lambdaproteobacteria bacterium]|nr:aspartate--tRNA ligase [Candidatus Lambdaproteobacteria bacterium]
MTLGLRSHHCGDLRTTHVGQTVLAMGWVDRRRDHGGVIFVDLRDHTGVLQVVFKPEVNAEAHGLGDSLRHEFVIAVQGRLAPREEGNVNPKLATGEVELLAERLEVLNTARPLPFAGEEEGVDERLRMKYRYLDLRRGPMQRNLRLRAHAARIVRSHLDAAGFCEIETPVLTRSTPEGARDYLVPSRVNPGQFYALPQSPQLFKQILMIGGFDRYYQIVRCFRDEDLRGNRQPEFTQVDLELTFVEPEEIFALIDGLFARLFRETIGVEVPLPIPRMTYQEAMDRFGSDAPDMRFGLELVQLTDLVARSGFKVFAQAAAAGGQVRAIRVPGGAQFSRKELDELTEFVAIYGAKGMAWVKRLDSGWQSPIAKFFSAAEQNAIEQRLELREGDLAVFCADAEKVVLDALGNLRKEIARRSGLIDERAFKFVWVTDFPLLEYDEQEQRLAAKHHPFTAPVVEDLERHGASDPLKIRARAYDIALNGVELGGGSIRMHKPELQQRVFRLLGMSEQEAERRFGFLLEALGYGAPPHGGIALGFDRIIMFLVGTASIRDVIAFPKTQKAADLMVQAPADVDDRQLRELGIRLRRP